MAWLVRLGLVESLQAFAGSFHFVMRYLVWGEHRSGFFMRAAGVSDDGQERIRAWHLVAEGDSGLAVPGLATVLLAKRYLAGHPPAPGARPALGELELDDFTPLLVEAGIAFGDRDEATRDDRALFTKILGASFDQLPEAIRSLHSTRGVQNYEGEAQVSGDSAIIARVARALFRMPRRGSKIPVEVSIVADGGTETWIRSFAGRRFRSELSAGGGNRAGLLRERFGPFSFFIALALDSDCLLFIVRHWQFFGIPLPRFLAPQGNIFERVEQGRFRFHVEMRFPLLGHFVTYDGWLQAIHPCKY
jgi:hypothetical protein